MTQIAIVTYPGFTALDFIGPYEVLRWLPDAEVRFVWHEPGPITADSGVLDHRGHPFVCRNPFARRDFGAGRNDHHRTRPRRDAAGLGASGASERDLDGVGVLGFDHPGGGRLAQRQTRRLALGGPSLLKTLGAIPVGDERVVHEGDIITSAGVSAGIDLALWLAGQIGGDERAKAIQLSMEYDPQPPFDSGHMSKASAKTKAAATALMARDIAKPAQLKAGTLLLWDRALSAARAKAARR